MLHFVRPIQAFAACNPVSSAVPDVKMRNLCDLNLEGSACRMQVKEDFGKHCVCVSYFDTCFIEANIKPCQLHRDTNLPW